MRDGKSMSFMALAIGGDVTMSTYSARILIMMREDDNARAAMRIVGDEVPCAM
jgi:hypothetical protein